VTVFDSVGFALEDFAALKVLHETALAFGIGQPVELVTHTPDPKNLFGALRCAAPASAPAATSAEGREQDAGLGLRDALDEAHALQHV
jgi:ornithine cyclodeaminase